MRCPVDGTTLAPTERAHVEMDYCPRCHGVWVDRGGLDRLIEHRAHDDPSLDRGADHDYYGERRDQPPRRRRRVFSELSELLGGGG